MIDADASRIEWAGRNPSTTHMGIVDISTGVIDIANGSITGSVDIDMTTIHNINLEGDEMHPVLEAHLHSDDFFFTKLFPKAVFSVKRAERIDPGWLTTPNYHVAGELNLRGVSADLEFDATIAHMENDSLVSKTLLKKEIGNITLFAFDKGQGLSEHTAPFDAVVQILDGSAEITIGGEPQQVSAGDMLIMPANISHALHATEKFKMLLVMIRSE